MLKRERRRLNYHEQEAAWSRDIVHRLENLLSVDYDSRDILKPLRPDVDEVFDQEKGRAH